MGSPKVHFSTSVLTPFALHVHRPFCDAGLCVAQEISYVVLVNSVLHVALYQTCASFVTEIR